MSPVSIKLTSLIISIWPLVILVATCNVWKNAVIDGSNPVGPAGIDTPFGANTPDLAGAGFLLFSKISWTSLKLPLQNIKPTLSLHNGISFSNFGAGFHVWILFS